MTKYGKILNIYFNHDYDAIVTDEHGNFVVEASNFVDKFSLRDPLTPGVVRISIDLEYGVITNWKEMTPTEIAEFIENCSARRD